MGIPLSISGTRRQSHTSTGEARGIEVAAQNKSFAPAAFVDELDQAAAVAEVQAAEVDVEAMNKGVAPRDNSALGDHVYAATVPLLRADRQHRTFRLKEEQNK